MYNKFLPKFKVVEINNMAALRMGHVIAQNAIDKENIRLVGKGESEAYKYLENGVIVGLGVDGKIANYDSAKHAQPMLVFTEELIAGPFYSLDQFAEEVELEGADVYPRCLPLYLGDTFTTDNVKVVEDGLYGIEAGSGLICKAGQEAQAMFRGVACKLPAGQNAVELQVINVKADLVPATEEEEDGE
jgi:hypothetical protein